MTIKDDKFMISASVGKSIKVFNLRTGEKVQHLVNIHQSKLYELINLVLELFLQINSDSLINNQIYYG